MALTAELAEPMARSYAVIAGADHTPQLDWALSVRGADPEDGDDGEGSASGGDLDDLFRAALAVKRPAELDRGLTLVGPHRDDLVLRVRGLPVRGYASHGESWSVALGLRLASADLLRLESQLGDPVLILDDVFAELDADRRERLARLVGDFEQVIVTAAVEPDVPDTLRAHVVRVEAGSIVGVDPAPAPEAADVG
jgi:DNA replication and repair protein RecF